MGGPTRRELRRVLVVLCISQITSWGVLYYAFPVMLVSVTATTGWTTGTALSAFSTGLLASAVAAPITGRLIDRHGPRPVMTAGSVLGVASLLAVAAATGLPMFFGAWILVGLAQSAVLYPPAFAALTGWYGQQQRVRAITTVTLVGGLASTVFAPLTAALLTVFSWRQTCVVLAVVLALVTIPLHALLLTPAWRTHHRSRSAAAAGSIAATVRSRQFVLLACGMALAGFGLYGATLNLIPLFTSRGISTGLAATALGLVGVGQVAGRIGYPTLVRHTSPSGRTVAILAIGAATVAVLGLLTGPTAALIAAAICAGAARGVFTLLQATGVSDRWGTGHFGSLNGIATAPSTAAIVIAPAGAALLADLVGSYTLAYYLLAAFALAGALMAFGTAPAPSATAG